MGKTYVVFVGTEPGICEDWEECRARVEGFSGARYKSYPTREEAIMAYRESDASASVLMRNISRHLNEESTDAVELPAKAKKSPKTKVAPKVKATKAAKTGGYPPEVITNSIAVDAGCMGNPGIMEYRGVYVQTGQEIFKVGPYKDGTNNIGEFLAIVHGLALLKQKGSNIPIYSDSVTAQKWVRDRKCRTQLKPTANNAVLLELVKRAEAWLASNTYSNPIIKWETKRWGEIPADFGRK